MCIQDAASFLTQVFLPITIGMAALFYTFAFTFFKNLLHELDEYLKNELKSDPNKEMSIKEKEIKKKEEYCNIVNYCHLGELIMHLLFSWCTFSFLFGVFSYMGLNSMYMTSDPIWWKIILGIVLAFLCALSVRLIYRDLNNKKIKVIGLGTAFLLAVPTLGSFFILFLIFCHDLSKILPVILLLMLMGLVFYLLYWFFMSFKYSPLRSLQELRGTVN